MQILDQEGHAGERSGGQRAFGEAARFFRCDMHDGGELGIARFDAGEGVVGEFARRSESQRAEPLEPLSLDGFTSEDREGLQDSRPALEQTIIARDMARQAFRALPRGKGAIICQRYFLRDETQTQIARDAGVSTPRINQVIAECVGVMREHLNA